jgi:hypothetical protein
VATTRVELTRGEFATIDLEDEHLTYPYKWYLTKSGRGAMYASGRASGERGLVKLHRLIMRAETGQVVTFIDGDGLNCRKSNLRIGDDCNIIRLTHYRETGNPNVKRPYRGVSVSRPNGRYQSIIVVHKRGIHLGMFDSPEDAARAYDDAARMYYGELAVTNFADAA